MFNRNCKKNAIVLYNLSAKILTQYSNLPLKPALLYVRIPDKPDENSLKTLKTLKTLLDQY